MDKPKQLQDVDLTQLRVDAQEYLDFIDNDEEYHEDGLDNYQQAVFERVMTTLYGREVWNWINNRQP